MSDQLCFRHSSQLSETQRAKFDKHFISFATNNGMVLDSYETRCFGIDRDDPVHLSFVGFIFIVFLLVTAAAIVYYRRHKRLQLAARELIPLRLKSTRDNDV